jgi:type IV pilus assembly protein PilQ
MAMIAKRLVVSLMLLALVSNVSVFASVNAGVRAESFALVSLKHENEGSLTRILIESSAPPLYAVYRPSDRLIVVDLPGGEASRLDQAYSVKSAVVDSITVRQSQPGASPASRSAARIEVSVRADARDRTTVNGNTLVIEVTPDLKPAPAKASTDKEAAGDSNGKRVSQTRNDTHAAVSGVMVYPTPIATSSVKPEPVVVEKARTSPTDLKPATLIRAVHSEAAGDAVRIVIAADGAAQYKDFVLPNPWRIVVDITGVRSAVGNKTTTVGNGQVERLRVGQPAPNVVRIVLDTKSKVPYRVVREGEGLVITIGDASSFQNDSVKTSSDAKATQNASSKDAAEPQRKPEVRVAGDRVENQSNDKKPADQSAKQAIETSNLLAQNNQRVTPQPNRNLPLPSQPATAPSTPKSAAMPVTQPTVNRSASDVARPQGNSAGQSGKRSDQAFCDPAYVGGLISFDLRAGVDLRDMLRFISQQYGVNFIVDKSVSATPVDIRVTDIPWNQVMESVLKANRLGAVCESNGRMIRIATLAAVKEEEDQQLAIREAQSNQVPLTTKIIHLKYARAAGTLSGKGSSGGSGGGGSSAGGAGGTSGVGSLRSIVESRLSKRGRVEVDIRTNSLIVTDLPEYMLVVEDMISKLDRPEPQVEIEARIVIANRNFLRDLGSELAGVAAGRNGRGGLFETTPVQVVDGSLQPGGSQGGSGGGSGSGSGSGSGNGSGGGSNQQKGLGPNLIGPFADTALRAGVANTVLSLTTGAIGTGLLSMAISASETKGQIRTIASPRVTTTDNKTAEIVNGVQIPVQTVSNNTITTTFVTAALRLEITPQIVEENGQVLMHVVAENNTVNFALAGQFNNGTPGINTQSAESTVLVQDGGTTVMGGINIDTEGHLINSTPGVSKIPLLGELFKRRQTRRETDEILFFLTPRIVRTDGTVGPRLPQRSSVEGMPNPAGPQRAAATPAPAVPDKKPESKPAASAPVSVTAASGKAGK